MDNFWDRSKIYFAITIWIIIIGVFVYFGLKNNNQNKIVSVPRVQTITSLQNLSQQTQIKSDSNVQNTNTVVCGAGNNTIVTKVIDGDTVVVEGGYHVRLLGMDADEKGYPCYEPAKTRLENLILSKQVRLEKDKTDIDQYGRCLRYIFLGSTNINVELVKEGLSVARFYNDVKYKPEITEAEKQAQENEIGCKWAK